MTSNTGRNLFFASLFGIMFWTMILASGTELTAETAVAEISLKDYAAILAMYVDDHGMVDYKGLKAHRKPLDDFISSLFRVDPKLYDGWNDREKIAFWINAYNALTLKAIVDHYPIEASFLKSFVYPKNSIRQIPGVWDKLTFPVMGNEMTLDGIEHNTLRAKFNEPRIHVALVCAARGCPPLRNEPYTGARLNSQLDDQAAKLLKKQEKLRIDRNNKKVYLSPIFDWFGQDFVKTYGTDKEFSGFSEKERAVLNFISRYVAPADRVYLMKGGFSIEYLKYDWSLNEKKI